jgi:hypothetical protein
LMEMVEEENVDQEDQYDVDFVHDLVNVLL